MAQKTLFTFWHGKQHTGKNNAAESHDFVCSDSFGRFVFTFSCDQTEFDDLPLDLRDSF